MKQKSQNYGSCFKELRQLAAFKYKDLEAIMSKTGIVKFEMELLIFHLRN